MSRLLGLVLRLVATVALALVLVRLLHTTEAGVALGQTVPAAAWTALAGALGVTGAEGEADLVLAVHLLAALVVAAVVVALVGGFAGRLLRRR